MPEKISEKLEVQDSANKTRVTISAAGEVTVFGNDGHRSLALLSTAPSLGGITGIWFGGSSDPSEGPKAAKVFIRDSAGNNSIILDGLAGDIILNNADCAEHFEISNSEEEAGTVMVIENEGKLQKSNCPYDRRVAGVLSCAGDFKPGIVLDGKASKKNQKPLALMGKVYCKAEAVSEPIEVGDLLTTSSIAGHAMKASDPLRSFGAVIGKALRPLKEGHGLIPILVTLQ